MEEIKLYVKKSDDQIPKTVSHHNKKHLRALSNGFLSRFITFSLYDKLIKLCPKMAAENLGGAKPRWSPQCYKEESN